MRRVTARTAHDIPERPPLRVAPGEQVECGRRDETWPEFVFVTTAHGSGWVPARHLLGDEGPTEVVAAYDTTELPTEVGQVLEVLDEDLVSGWYWCRAADGREGWVPISTLEP
ncbi:MAG: SH3 domain-containing protein [Tetrasphaera sp.]